MRESFPEELERGRVVTGHYASERGSLYGAFQVGLLYIIFGAGDGWEHASVSRERRCPLWTDMHRVKQLIWRDDEAVMQLHPPQSEYVNRHPYCLHMWRPINVAIPMPPRSMV